MSKYIKGALITSLDDLMKRDFIWFEPNGPHGFTKVYNVGWFKSWQLHMALRMIAGKCLYAAIPKDMMVPQKPTHQEAFEITPTCPNCMNALIDKPTSCPRCGQVIDWSD